jgi:gas vesicle protein
VNLSKNVDDLTDRLATRVDDLRDKAASTMGSLEDRALTGEVRRVGERIQKLEDRLTSGLADLADSHMSQLEQIAQDQGTRIESLIGGTRRTTWPRRLFWAGVGLAAGAAAAFIADPDQGRTRRARLGDQVAARGRDLAREAEQEGRYLAGKTKGAVIEAAKSTLPEDVPTDPRTLEQRIRSHVFGFRDDVDDVVIVVDEPGEVSLKGRVPNEDSARELVTAVQGVAGVREVQSELAVQGSQT